MKKYYISNFIFGLYDASLNGESLRKKIYHWSGDPSPELITYKSNLSNKKKQYQFTDFVVTTNEDSSKISFDSLYFNLIYKEYLRINQIKTDSTFNELKSHLKSSSVYDCFLFLNPHEEFTIRRYYSFFKKNKGRYKTKIQKRSFELYYTIDTVIINNKVRVVTKLPPPKYINGYERYDDAIESNELEFTIK